MPTNTPANRCRACGATSYKPVLARDDTGAMRPSQRYQCTGCDVTFTALSECRDVPAAYATWAPTPQMFGSALA